MIPPLYTTIYSEATSRPEYYKVQPDQAIAQLQDFPYFPGTYLISQGEGFCELIFTFVYLDHKIYQFIAKLIWDNNQFVWNFNNRNFSCITELVFKSKIDGLCFLIYEYTPFMKIAGYVPILLIHEISFLLAKCGKEGDYFLTQDAQCGPQDIKIVRNSRERNGVDIYSFKATEAKLNLPRRLVKQLDLKRPVGLLASYEKELFATNSLLKLGERKNS